jgi:DNA-binding transcriptional regulator YdaS (Cro superfamily)
MDTDSPKKALLEAREIVGGAVGLGRLLGISSQAVSQWEQVPAPRVLEVERATGVSRHRLRPDIFGPLTPAAAAHAEGAAA